MMKIECDAELDWLYVWFGTPGTATRTEIITPGVHADFDEQSKLIGLEVLDASQILGTKVNFEVALRSMAAMR